MVPWFRRGPARAGLRILFLLLACAAVRAADPVRVLSFDDVAPAVQQLLGRYGITRENLSDRLATLRQRNRARAAEGDRDHLVYYILQSTSFTSLPPVEPAVSARELASAGTIPASAKARLAAFAAAHRNRRNYGARMAFFRELVARDAIDVESEYLRAMKSAAPVGARYQERGLSTDTTIDAGYVVYLSLSALRQLQPDLQIRSALIVGPGLDLAPRTSLVEAGAPQSYQPFAVMDALVATGLSRRDALRITAADINPRVTEWVMKVRGGRSALTLVSSIGDTQQVRLSDDYREYFAALGRAIGVEAPLRGLERGRLGKSLAVSSRVTGALDAATLDITVEHIGARYDLVVVTNVFPYLSDAELLLAIANIAGMLAPGGILIHNEPRPVMADALFALGMPLLQSRSGVVANVDGGTPLYDTAWMHAHP